MRRTTAINMVIGTDYVKAAMMEPAMKSTISTPEISNVLTKATRNTWVSTMISSTDIATDIRPDTTTATTTGPYALTCMDSMSATIRIDCRAGTRTPTRIPNVDTLTSPWIQATEAAFRLDRT